MPTADKLKTGQTSSSQLPPPYRPEKSAWREKETRQVGRDLRSSTVRQTVPGRLDPRRRTGARAAASPSPTGGPHVPDSAAGSPAAAHLHWTQQQQEEAEGRAVRAHAATARGYDVGGTRLSGLGVPGGLWTPRGMRERRRKCRWLAAGCGRRSGRKRATPAPPLVGGLRSGAGLAARHLGRRLGTGDSKSWLLTF